MVVEPARNQVLEAKTRAWRGVGEAVALCLLGDGCDMANPKLQYSILMRSPVARSQDLADGFVRSVSLV
jgi:hypothetical protein